MEEYVYTPINMVKSQEKSNVCSCIDLENAFKSIEIQSRLFRVLNKIELEEKI